MTVASINAQSELRMPKSNDTDFTWRLADKSLTTVVFNNLLEDPSELSDKVLEMVVMNIMVQSKFTLKNKNSFKPTKLNILKTSMGFNAVSYYTGENAYGTEIESTTYFSFVNEGDGSVKKVR
tara:strand:- start:132 stop:500 length:369 start_codon:yes stop_codon:yes gene_type:complete